MPAREPTLEERIARIVVMEGDDPGRAAEVVGIIDVSDASASLAEGMWLLRRRAAELRADAVIGVELHGSRRGLRVSGLAVRFTTSSTSPTASR